MFYFPNLNIVYCPVERTASRSTEDYIRQHDPDVYRLGNHRHSCSLDELNGLSPSKIYVSVRHPWDRLCSMFTADLEKMDSGYMKYWDSLNNYLDFYLANQSLEFLTEGNTVIPNLTIPMSKLVNNEPIHFHRSQDIYLSVLSGLNVTYLEYANVGTIVNESWANSNIEFPVIGETENNANSHYTVELENKLKTLWVNDYNRYSNWSIN